MNLSGLGAEDVRAAQLGGLCGTVLSSADGLVAPEDRLGCRCRFAGKRRGRPPALPPFVRRAAPPSATLRTMPDRSSKRPRDVNALAYHLAREAVGDEPTVEPPEQEREKNPAAVELGRRGGLKGGKARAEKLSTKKRSEIAKKAAAARWKKG